MRSQRKIILILDSDYDRSCGIKNYLEQAGFCCHELFLIAQLKRVLKAKASHIYCVICATQLPDGSKFDVERLCQEYGITSSPII